MASRSAKRLRTSSSSSSSSSPPSLSSSPSLSLSSSSLSLSSSPISSNTHLSLIHKIESHLREITSLVVSNNTSSFNHDLLSELVSFETLANDTLSRLITRSEKTTEKVLLDVFRVSSNLKFFGAKAMLSLASTSHKVLDILAPVRFQFRQKKEGDFVFYNPCKLVQVNQLPISSHATHISVIGDAQDLENSYHFNFNHLPSTITHLEIRCRFRSVIDNLPPSLKKLKFVFPCNFNHPISCLPPSLTYLSLPYKFNSSPYPLPQNLKYLSLGTRFNQQLEYLPSGLIKLKLGYDFDQLIPQIPNSLKSFKISNTEYRHPLTFSNPNNSSLTSLKGIFILSDNIKLLPNLTKLDLSSAFNSTLDGKLPQSLKKLIVGNHFNQPITNLPSSLTYLSFGDEFNQSLDHLPLSLEYLILGQNFSFPLNNNLLSLQHLVVGGGYEDNPITQLPPSLKTLDLGYGIEERSARNFPNTMTNVSVRSGDFKIVTQPKNISIDCRNITHMRSQNGRLILYNKNGDLNSFKFDFVNNKGDFRKLDA